MHFKSFLICISFPSLSISYNLHVEELGPLNLWVFHSLDFAAVQHVPLVLCFPCKLIAGHRALAELCYDIVLYCVVLYCTVFYPIVSRLIMSGCFLFRDNQRLILNAQIHYFCGVWKMMIF